EILVTAVELHGERSSNFPYIASVTRQLLGSSGMSFHSPWWHEFGISWYQQRPGHSLTYLLYYNSERDKHKPAKTPDRFSATKDLTSNACILIIASACHEDNGNYYCSLSRAFNWF
uniref:V-set pre-B cell surrogate light chain 3 n=1 Tax=Strix occidentalis caurina TaxID=311401 RepID=A0A8D0KU80_STROC